MTRTQQEFLDSASRALDAIDAQARVLLDRLDTQAFNRPPRKGGWSPGQCFEHLVKVGVLYLTPMEQSLERAVAKRVGATNGQNGQKDGVALRHSPTERFFIWMLEPPARVKLPAPPIVQSMSPWLDPIVISTAYFDGHDGLRRFITNAQSIDIKRARVVSPFASQLRFSLAAALDIMLAHERRHLWQAERAAR